MKVHKIESLMTEKDALSDENGDTMPKRTKKVQTVFFGMLLVLVIIFMTSGTLGIGGEKNKEEDSRENAALEQTLMQIEGVGEVELYFHYNKGEEADPLSDYFSLSQTKSDQRENNIEGILVVAEGGGDPSLQNKLTKMLATVLQLPEHRIVIVEMKKGRNIDENK